LKLTRLRDKGDIRELRIVRSIFIAVAVALLFTASAFSQTDTDRRLKDEMGLTRMTAAYPAPGARINETTPMIAADASNLAVPMDPTSARIFLNGADVTDNAEITQAYIVYQPADPLRAGQYDVRITAKDMNKNDIEPLSWSFFIGSSGAAGAGGLTAVSNEDNTSGRVSISTDYVTAAYVPQSSLDVSQIFKEKEGMKFNTDLSFANSSSGRTLVGTIHRETQYYTDIEIDKVRLNYNDDNFSAVLGNAWFSLSDLTVLGTELAGMRVDRRDGPWGLTVFSGRTQDPSTSGTFKQMTSGLRGSYDWNKKNTSYITALTAVEKDDEEHALSGTPSRDALIGGMHEYKITQDLTASFEGVLNTHRFKDTAESQHSGAWRAALTGSLKDFSGEAEAYDIGADFLPIAEGSSKYLKSDRKGYRAKGSYKVTEFLTTGGEYEQYDTRSTDITTKRGNAFVTVNYEMLQALTYRKSKLVSNGTVSESDGVTATLLLPPTKVFTETRLGGVWQNNTYTGSGVVTDTTVNMFSLSTSFKDILSLSAGYGISDSDSLTVSTATGANSKNKNLYVSLGWNIIPFKLMWTGRYEMSENTGTSVDNSEKWYKTGLKYAFDKTYSMNLSYENGKYSDTVTPVYDYSQDIIRTGLEVIF